MDHFLETSHEELERTHRIAENYKAKHLKSIFNSWLPGSFKKTLQSYASEKENLILGYEHLHNDIHSKRIDPKTDTFISQELNEIIANIEICSKLLTKLVAHSDSQAEIIEHEKIFFLALLESFGKDLLLWVELHETEIFWHTDSLPDSDHTNPIKKWIQKLRYKKQKLEQHLQNNSNK